MTQEEQELQTFHRLPGNQQERFMNMAHQDSFADRRQLKPEWTEAQVMARAAHYAHTLSSGGPNEPDVTVYRLVRHRDRSGVSGTGHVADCVVFPSGKAVVAWRVEPYAVTYYETLEQARSVHSHGEDTEFQPVGGAA